MRIDEIERELKETERLLAQATELFKARKFKEAHPLYERSFAMLKTSFGAEDSRTLGCLSALADTCYELRRFDEAAGHYHKALAVKERRGELKDHEYPSSLFKLAKAYAQIPRPQEAVKYFTRAAEISKEMLLTGDPLLGNILEAHAALLQRMGNGSGAEALMEESRANRQRYGSNSQVVDRYMQPLSGLQFQTIPPGQNFRPNLDIPANVENDKRTSAFPLLLVSKMLKAVFVVLAILGVLAFLLVTLGPHSSRPKVEYIIEPETEQVVPSSSSGSSSGSGTTITRAAAKRVTPHHTGSGPRKQPLHIVRSKPTAVTPVKSAPAAKAAPGTKTAPGNQWNQLKNLREYN